MYNIDTKHIESYSGNVLKISSNENKKIHQNNSNNYLDPIAQSQSPNINLDTYGDNYLSENLEYKTYQSNIFDPIHTTSDNFDFNTKQAEITRDYHFNQIIDREIMNKKSRISKHEIKDIIDAQTHNTFDDTIYEDKNMLTKFTTRRNNLGLDLNQTWADNRIIDNNKWLSIQKYEDDITTKEKSFRSNNLINEVTDQSESGSIENRLEFDKYQTELRPNYEMKRIISK